MLLIIVLKRFLGRIGAEWRLRRSIDTLRSFDDRMLTDIGLSRGSVEYAVRHGRRPSRPDIV
jgi:uncharacterized protein YjiS (DUF1127 family)